jgi:hypothetical protein
MKELPFLLLFRQHHKGQIDEPMTVPLKNEISPVELSAAWGVAFLTDQIGSMPVWPPSEVHDLTSSWIVG